MLDCHFKLSLLPDFDQRMAKQNNKQTNKQTTQEKKANNCCDLKPIIHMY